MIIWVDTETTGLRPRDGYLLEVALVVTDDELNEIAASSIVVAPVGPSIDAMVANMDPVVHTMHTKNGLIGELREGRGARRYEAEDDLIAFVRANAMTLPDGLDVLKKTPLAGSTVSFDRAFLKEHMPKLEGLFSYRSIDVSSLTELAKRWAPALYENRPKKDPALIAHRALADVRESINILKYYRECGFIGGVK